MTPAPVTDMHAHFVPREFPDLVDTFGTAGWPWMRQDDDTHATIMVGREAFRAVDSRCWDAARRLEDMERDGVGIQVVSPTPVFFAYERPPDQAAHAARVMNDLMATMVAAGNRRLCGLGQVPLQDTDAACAEASRCMESGFVGVEIGTHVGADELDSGGVVTFLQHCAAIGAAVFVHPWDVLGGDRLADFMSAWTVGMVAETHLSIVRLVLSGAFDRLPTSLRIAFAHGGGSFAFALGRLDNAWVRAPAARGSCEHPPSSYTGRFFVDSAVFAPASLRLLVDVMGERQILLGSDYPYPLGEQEVGSLIATADLSERQRDLLLGGNARRFLGLDDRRGPGPAG